MTPQPRYRPGDKIGGRYQVHQALMGGMGEVYLCLDLETIQPYALKTFQQRYLGGSKRLRAAFEQEVATWVALEKHPNIVRCFYMDILDNQPFMILEWVAGEEGRGADLRGWLRRGPLDLRLALDFTIDICRGLIHAQEKQPGIVHRDLKPENILVAQGRLAKITDWGLAKIVQEAELEVMAAEGETDGRESLMGQGGVVGTPPYMAPEQWQGESVDARTDIYAVGCVLYEMLTSNWPFFAATLDSLRRQHLEASIPKLADGQSLPNELDTVIARCLAKRRDKRFVTVRDLLQELVPIYHRHFAELPKDFSINDEFTFIDYNNRGATYIKLQRYEEALTDLDRAIQLEPTYAQAYSNRGALYEKLNQYDEALADYNRAIQLEPTFSRTYSNRGSTYYTLQYYEKALADHNRALELEPTYAQGYSNRGDVYRSLQRNEEARADYTRAIELNPKYAPAYSNRGLIYENLQHYNKALVDYSKAIELDPTLTQAYFNRGNTYAKLQRHDEALADYIYITQLDPTDAEAHLNAGALLANRGALQDALPYFERAAQLGHTKGSESTKMIKQTLRVASALQVDPAQLQLGMNALINADSLNEIQSAAAQFPFLTDIDSIVAIERDITQTAPPHLSFDLEQRLAWLRQIANEHTGEEQNQ